VGAAIAPNAGHMHSGAWTHTAWSTTGRALTAFGTVLFWFPAPPLAVASGIGFVAINLYDLIDAFFVPRRMYRRRIQERSFDVAVLPVPLETGDGHWAPGLVWTGRF